MYRHSLKIAIKATVLFVVVAFAVLPFLTGCDLIDQLLGSGGIGGGNTGGIQAVMTAQLNDQLVNRGLNPDHRPPLRYDFSATDSLDEYGDPIHKPNYEVGWDFGDGKTRGFEWSDYNLTHIYREEGTYTATLTVREAPIYGNASATAQKTITIGPGWLEIVSLTTERRPDGQFNVTVVVRNQSNQALHGIRVDLLANGVLLPIVLEADLMGETPDRVPPNGTYILRGVIGPWTGELRARSSWCVPWPDGQ